VAGLWLAIGYRLRGARLLPAHRHDPLRHRGAADRRYTLWPFGATVVQRADAGPASAIGNVLWSLLRLVAGTRARRRRHRACLTIVGIRSACLLQARRRLPLALGREVVSVQEAELLRAGPAF